MLLGFGSCRCRNYSSTSLLFKSFVRDVQDRIHGRVLRSLSKPSLDLLPSFRRKFRNRFPDHALEEIRIRHKPSSYPATWNFPGTSAVPPVNAYGCRPPAPEITPIRYVCMSTLRVTSAFTTFVQAVATPNLASSSSSPDIQRNPAVSRLNAATSSANDPVSRVSDGACANPASSEADASPSRISECVCPTPTPNVAASG